MEDTLRDLEYANYKTLEYVLILVLMEDTLRVGGGVYSYPNMES